MAGIQYGTENPRAIDPFSIESTLAPLAAGGSTAEAQNLLQQYHFQNQVAEDQYNANLQSQHDFAYAQLAQQMAAEKLKALGEAKDPTVLQLYANSPEYRGVLGGISDAALGDIVGRARYGQDVTNLEHFGQGYNAISQGGGDPTTVAGQFGYNFGPNQGPALVQAARIRAAAQVAAANASANAANQPGLTTTYTDDRGFTHGLTTKIDPRGGTTGQVEDADKVLSDWKTWVEGGRQGPPPSTSLPVVPRRSIVPGLATAGPGNMPGQQTRAAPQPGSTSLSYAQTEGGPGTPAPQTPPAPQAQTTTTAQPQTTQQQPRFTPIPTAGASKLQADVMKRIDVLRQNNDPLYQRLKPQSSVAPLFTGPDGKVYVQTNDKQQFVEVPGVR